MTVDFALHLASAAARVLAPQGGKVLIGKDTRLSGYMFESALEAGFVAAGVDVLLIGPLPTPGIAYLTRKFECRFGVVISASHNAFDDNGIKFFDADGGKLSDELEERIEAELAARSGDARIGAAGPCHARGQVAGGIPGVLRLHHAAGSGPHGHEDRHRLRQWRRLQGRAAACSPIWAPKSCRWAARPMAATSMMAAVPWRRSCCS